MRAIDKADVALLVIDASEGVTSQDQRLAERVDAAGCPIVILMNKWEVVSQEKKDELMYQVGQRLHFLGESPVLRISALTGRGVHRLVPALEASERSDPAGPVSPSRTARRASPLCNSRRNSSTHFHIVHQ